MALLGSGCLRRPQHTPGPLVLSRFQTQWKCNPQKGNTVNATDLARNKFNALFVDHDAEDTRGHTSAKARIESGQEGSKLRRAA
jgi:hypothetical protein